MSKRKTPTKIDDSKHAMIKTIADLCKKAGVDSGPVLAQWEANRVRLLLDHEVTFSIECYGFLDAVCQNGDNIDNHAQAVAAGWTQIEPASASNMIAHFIGMCPTCGEEERKEQAEFNRKKK